MNSYEFSIYIVFSEDVHVIHNILGLKSFVRILMHYSNVNISFEQNWLWFCFINTQSEELHCWFVTISLITKGFIIITIMFKEYEHESKTFFGISLSWNWYRFNFKKY